MAEEKGMYISPAQLQEMMLTLVAKMKELNPLEQKAYDEKMAAEKRKTEMMKTLGAIEEQAMKAKKNGCSHSRYPMSHGKLGGHAAPRGQGEWCTAGQVHGHNIIGLICQRCASSWIFEGTPQEIEYANNAGLLGFPPPDEKRCIQAA